MLDWSIEQNEHPVAIRIPCNGVISDDRKVYTDYSNINKFKVEEKGEKVAIIALGDFYQLGEEVSKELKEKLNINFNQPKIYHRNRQRIVRRIKIKS